MSSDFEVWLISHLTEYEDEILSEYASVCFGITAKNVSERMKDVELYVFYFTGFPIGFLFARDFGSFCYISDVCVAPEFQGQNYCKKALEEMATKFPIGKKRWVLMVDGLDNIPAIKSYERVGFKFFELEGVEKDVLYQQYGEGHYMERTVTKPFKPMVDTIQGKQGILNGK
jgi:ribosomal protein S18 acetylase RimI-like enzyme